MIYKSYSPKSELQPYIVHYWTMKSGGQDKKGDVFRFIPDGYTDWVFHFDSRWKHRTADSPLFSDTDRFHVFGQLKSYLDLIQTTEKIDVFGIKFNPFFASHFFGDDMSVHTNKCYGILDLAIPFITDFIDKLMTAESIGEKISLTDRYLLELMTNHMKTPDLHAAFPPNNLTFGQRRLEQHYKSKIGISPKLFSRIGHFNKVINDLVFRENPHLTEFTYEHGFFDQSHFIKVFKKFTGHTPSSFLRKIDPSNDFYNLKA